MEKQEREARAKAARKMGLVKDPEGLNLPDDIWMQALPPAVLAGEIVRLRENKRAAYEERNRLVALLASMFPSGRARTAIPGWSPEWHGCVYIDFSWGQASWHYHDEQAHLFEHLPPYPGTWDGHTTEEKYAAIQRAAIGAPA